MSLTTIMLAVLTNCGTVLAMSLLHEVKYARARVSSDPYYPVYLRFYQVEIVSIRKICFTTSSSRRLIVYFIAVQSKDASNIMNSSVNKMHNIKYC